MSSSRHDLCYFREQTQASSLLEMGKRIFPGLYRGPRKTFSIKRIINIKPNSSLDLGPAAAKLQLLTKIARRGGEARCVCRLNSLIDQFILSTLTTGHPLEPSILLLIKQITRIIITNSCATTLFSSLELRQKKSWFFTATLAGLGRWRRRRSGQTKITFHCTQSDGPRGRKMNGANKSRFGQHLVSISHTKEWSRRKNIKRLENSSALSRVFLKNWFHSAINLVSLSDGNIFAYWFVLETSRPFLGILRSWFCSHSPTANYPIFISSGTPAYGLGCLFSQPNIALI